MKRKLIKRAFRALNLDLFNLVQAKPPVPVPDIKILSHDKDNNRKTVLKEPLKTLPTIEILYQMFDRLNLLYWDGKLPRVRIAYSKRMFSAGSYTPIHKLIKIGVKYHDIFPEDLTDTLKHEMIHILHFKHDTDFKREAKRVGTTLKARGHPSLRKTPRYNYICPNCGLLYPRQKRFRMASCGKCSNGKFNTRFKLKLIQK